MTAAGDVFSLIGCLYCALLATTRRRGPALSPSSAACSGRSALWPTCWIQAGGPIPSGAPGSEQCAPPFSSRFRPTHDRRPDRRPQSARTDGGASIQGARRRPSSFAHQRAERGSRPRGHIFPDSMRGRAVCLPHLKAKHRPGRPAQPVQPRRRPGESAGERARPRGAGTVVFGLEPQQHSQEE